MKVLLDHNLPKRLARMLAVPMVRTAFQQGWSTLKNGELLSAAEQGSFDVLLTGDKNLTYQQNNAKRTIALVVLSTNHQPSVLASIEQIRAAIGRCTAGSYEFVTITRVD